MLHSVRPILMLLSVAGVRLTVLLVLPLVQHHVLVTTHLRVVMESGLGLRLLRYWLHHDLGEALGQISMVLVVLALAAEIVSHVIANLLVRPKYFLALHTVLHRVLLRYVLTAVRALLVFWSSHRLDLWELLKRRINVVVFQDLAQFLLVRV